MLNKDSWGLGLLIGILLPVLVYIPVILSFATFGHVDGILYKVPALIAVAANLFALRYYMVNRKYDKTGRGILIVTFVYVVMMFSLL